MQECRDAKDQEIAQLSASLESTRLEVSGKKFPVQYPVCL